MNKGLTLGWIFQVSPIDNDIISRLELYDMASNLMPDTQICGKRKLKKAALGVDQNQAVPVGGVDVTASVIESGGPVLPVGGVDVTASVIESGGPVLPVGGVDVTASVIESGGPVLPVGGVDVTASVIESGGPVLPVGGVDVTASVIESGGPVLPVGGVDVTASVIESEENPPNDDSLQCLSNFFADKEDVELNQSSNFEVNLTLTPPPATQRANHSFNKTTSSDDEDEIDPFSQDSMQHNVLSEDPQQSSSTCCALYVCSHNPHLVSAHNNLMNSCMLISFCSYPNKDVGRIA
jgi:hypothetical protein